MKRCLSFSLVVILIPGLFLTISDPGYKGVSPSPDTLSNISENPDDTFRILSNTAFAAGEKLDYDISYGPIVAGSATILTSSYESYNNRKCYKVEFTMRSAKFFDIFFKVRDTYSSIIDAEGLFPWKFEQHQKEGGYKKDFEAWFDQGNHVAKTSEGGPYSIPPYTQDAVSTFFYARTLNYDTMQVGQKVHFTNFYQDKVYPLDVEYLGLQDVETKAGKFHCQMIEPVIVKGGLFRNTGKIVVWITNDSLKVPVKVQTQVTIGSVVAELVGYSGLDGVMTSKF
ncbi:MAG TPA: DUF3108 domain-containing protein [Candidatus Acidoferrales bacterium]|nr:DUF3108 domain-containing protein [Candidatus Acidoferrales bacterium]